MSIQIRMTDYAWNGTALLSPGDTPSLDGSVAADLVNGGKAMYISERESNKEMSDVKANVDPVTGGSVFYTNDGGRMLAQGANGNTFVLFGDSLTEMCHAITTLTPGSEISASGGICTIARGSTQGLYSGQLVGIYRTPDEDYLGLHRITVTGGSSSTFPISATAAAQPELRSYATTVGMFVYGKTSDRSWFSWGNSLSGCRARCVNVSAVGGDRTEHLLERINSDFNGVPSYLPSYCTVLIGINDLVNSVSADTVITNLESIYATLLNNGVRVIAITLTPLASGHASYGNATVAQNILKVNRYIRKKATETTGMFLCDFFSVIADPLATTLGAASGMLATDGIHFSAQGARAAGVLFADVLQSLIPSQNLLVASAADSYSVSSASAQLFDNPLFIGTGGTKNTGFTGTVANNVTVGRSGSGSHTGVCAVVPRSDGVGNNQQVAITFTANNEIAEIKNTTSVHGRVSEGDLIRTVCSLKWTGATNIKSIRVLVYATDGTSYPTTEAREQSATTYNQSDFDGVFITPPFRVPAGMTSISAKVYVVAAGAGGITIEVGRMTLTKDDYSESSLI